VATAAATLFLIFVGGTVTSNDAGLAVPDWPTTFGENMFLYHPRNWVGDVFFEHGHRLAGAAVGLIAVGLAVWTQRCDPRPAVRWFGWALLAAVIVQGVMGGIRVNERSIAWAVVHGCFAQLFFAASVWMMFITSPAWFDAVEAPAAPVPRFWMGVCAATPVVVFGQLVAGAIYRHLHMGLAWHVVGAILVTIVVCVMVMWVSGEHADRALLLRLVKWLGAVLVIQLSIGVAAYVATASADPAREATFWQWFIPSLHVAVGALVLALSGALVLGVHTLMGSDSRLRTARSSSNMSPMGSSP
jgi:cytochrome c oxidase assembly protein subunit 15